MSERREQIDMLFEWQEELNNLDNYEFERVISYIEQNNNILITDSGKDIVRKIMKQFEISEILSAIDIAFEQYENSEIAFDKIAGICATVRYQKTHPESKKINYLIKIAKNRLVYLNVRILKNFLQKNYTEEDFDELKNIFSSTRNWTTLQMELNEFYDLGGLIWR